MHANLVNAYAYVFCDINPSACYFHVDLKAKKVQLILQSLAVYYVRKYVSRLTNISFRAGSGNIPEMIYGITDIFFLASATGKAEISVYLKLFYKYLLKLIKGVLKWKNQAWASTRGL